MKKFIFILLFACTSAAFIGCQQEQKSETDKDAKAKRSNKGDNAQEVQD